MISFVIPCYNEEKNVSEIYKAISQCFGEKNIPFECVMVNDGSKDGTMKALRALYETVDKSTLKIINFSRNFGKEAAIFCGLKHAKGDYVCLIDADLQQRPEVAYEMYEKLLADPDIDCVAAFQKVRIEGKLLSFFKRCFYKMINKMCDMQFVQGASDFRMFRRGMADAILNLPEYHRFSKGIFSFVGFNTYFMPYVAEERLSGNSSWSFRKLFRYALDGIIGYSTAPLKIATVLGVVFSGFAVIYMIVLLIKTLVTGIQVPGYATQVMLILLIGGIQLLMLGIIGEYLAKTYIQVKDRPIYIEKEVLEEVQSDNKETN